MNERIEELRNEINKALDTIQNTKNENKLVKARKNLEHNIRLFSNLNMNRIDENTDKTTVSCQF